ncbi:MAG: hypothetical protein IPK13_19575 [Deltaproteobacteria bacterium]|nr:hypothetical protein [Deltaproteobacteria bacterium]
MTVYTTTVPGTQRPLLRPREEAGFVARHAEAIRLYHRSLEPSATAEGFHAFSRSPQYRAMLLDVRAAVVARRSNRHNTKADLIVSQAAEALGVPTSDLERLADAPLYLVASGDWRPRAVNVRFLERNASSRPVPAGRVQDALNRLSTHLPGVKTYSVPLLYNCYLEAATVLPALDAVGKRFSYELTKAADVVRGWSDALATDVQKRLREIGAMGHGAGLRMRALRRLPATDQRAVILAGRALGAASSDLDTLVNTVRAKDDAGASSLHRRFARWSSTALAGLSSVLESLAHFVHHTTDEDAWRTFAIHFQTGPGIEKFLIATRAGPILMFPTLEQALREGKANVRVVVKANPLDTLFVSASVSSRGGGWGFRAGPVGASMTNFEHEVKFNLPGIFGLSLGEDYAYGPMLAFGYSPKMDAISWRLPVNVRGGGQLKIYHEGLRPLTDPTRHTAEVFANSFELAQRVLADVFPRVTGKHAHRSIRRGWPNSEYWQHVRRKVERVAGAYRAAELRLEVLRAASEHAGTVGHGAPEKPGARPMGTAAIVERARSCGLSANEAARFPEIATEYLESFAKDALRDLAIVERAGQRAKAGEGYNRPILMNTLKRLEGRTKAFEYCDTLFRKILPVPEPAGLPDRRPERRPDAPPSKR